MLMPMRRPGRTILPLAIVAAASMLALEIGSGFARADEPAPAVVERTPWTASKFAGTPEPPPPYSVELAFPQLKFEFPVVLVSEPGTNRLFLGDLRGRIVSFPDDPAVDHADLAIDGKALHPDLTMFYGLAFHPKFEQNGYVYVCYVRENDRDDGSVVSPVHRATDRPARDRPGERTGDPHVLVGRAQRRLPGRSAPTACSTSPPATAPAPRLPTRATPARTAPTCSRASCASTSTTPTRARPTASRRTIRSWRCRASGPRSGRSASATRGR